MEIILTPDWDIPVQIPNKEQTKKIGHFVGRKAELAVFVNELLRREQGAILVTGYRGVGKTSFVHQALHELIKQLKQYDKKKVLFVLVNGNHLESDGYSRSLEPKSILVNLIRRLYASTQEEKLRPELKQDIETLYKKAVSSEFKLSEAIEKNKQISKETEISQQTEISAQQLNTTQIIWLISFMLALTTQIFPVLPNQVWLSKTLPLLFAFPVPLLLSFVWKAGKKTMTSEARIDSAQQLYTMDNSVNNLEFDLEKLHNELRKDGIKTIYVLDELDKLDVDTIFDSMKYFKNLFTFSSALFVFVGGEELLQKYQVEDSSDTYESRNTPINYRPPEYTYFSSKYFLARPSDVDLLTFLDEIIYNFDEIKSDPTFEDFKRSLIFEAKCDFFDLIQIIKGKITGFDNERPILANESNSETKLEADLQKALSVLFGEKYASSIPSRWLENEVILRALYHKAEALLEKNPGDFVEEYSSSARESAFGRHTVQLSNFAVNDLYRFLHRIGFLELSNRELESNRYYRGTRIEEEIPAKMLGLSVYELELASKVERLYQIVLNYCNFSETLQRASRISFTEFKSEPQRYAVRLNRWGRDARITLSELTPIYQNLVNGQPMKMDDVQKYTNQADQAILRLTKDSYVLLCEIFMDAFKGINFQLSDITQSNDLLKDDRQGKFPEYLSLITDHANHYGDGKTYQSSAHVSGKVLIFGLPNKLLVADVLKHSVIFLPKCIDNEKFNPDLVNDETVVGCILNNEIRGFIFSPNNMDDRSFTDGIETILAYSTGDSQIVSTQPD